MCPRYYGSACRLTSRDWIDVAGTGPASLRVTVPARQLDWTVEARQTPLLLVLNTVTLPCRSVLAVGQAAWEILDSQEYDRTRTDTFPGR